MNVKKCACIANSCTFTEQEGYICACIAARLCIGNLQLASSEKKSTNDTHQRFRRPVPTNTCNYNILGGYAQGLKIS